MRCPPPVGVHAAHEYPESLECSAQSSRMRVRARGDTPYSRGQAWRTVDQAGDRHRHRRSRCRGRPIRRRVVVPRRNARLRLARRPGPKGGTVAISFADVSRRGMKTSSGSSRTRRGMLAQDRDPAPTCGPLTRRWKRKYWGVQRPDNQPDAASFMILTIVSSTSCATPSSCGAFTRGS